MLKVSLNTQTLLRIDCTCIKGGKEIVHLYLDEHSGEGCVKKECFWSVVGQSSVKKNNDKDKTERLVTIIHVFLGKFEDTKGLIRSRKSQDRQYNGNKIKNK
jgi:hypothetical protein